MITKEISFTTPEENILYDDVLLHLAEKNNGFEVLRFWESQQYFIVLGKIGKVEEDVKIKKVKEDKIVVVRRSSGGGTVLQGKGCLNYSLILSKHTYPQVADLKTSYSFILGKVILALKNMGVESSYFPISDIALADNKKKVSGNAQKRLRNHILHHGTILYDFDLEKIKKYLKMPKSIPYYRSNRGHLDFVTNLPKKDIEIFKRGLKREFCAVESDNCIKNEEMKLLEKLKQDYKALIV